MIGRDTLKMFLYEKVPYEMVFDINKKFYKDMNNSVKHQILLETAFIQTL